MNEPKGQTHYKHPHSPTCPTMQYWCRPPPLTGTAQHAAHVTSHVVTWRHRYWRDVTRPGVTSHVSWRDVAWFSDSVRYLLACCYDFAGFVEKYEVWVWYSFAVVAAFRAPNTFSHYTLHLQSCMNGMLLSINLVFSLNMTSLKICWFLNIWVPVTQGWNIFCFTSL